MHPYKFQLSFRVHHPTATSAEIITLIGKKPSVEWDVGKARMTPKGTPQPGVYDLTYCVFDVSEGLDSALVDSIRKWNRFLAPKKRSLVKLRRTGGRFDYFLGIYINSNGGLVLPPEVLRETAELGIELGLDMYGFVGEENESSPT
jgi:hypothetical protein